MPLVHTSWLIVHVRAVALAACEKEHSAGFWPLPDTQYSIQYTYYKQSIIGCGVVATDAEEDRCLFKSRDSLVGH